MTYNLGFGKINIIDGNIAEIIINDNIEMSLEMVEECEQFFSQHFSDNFGILVNKINAYQYSFEAKLTIGMNEKLCAIAVINYHQNGRKQTDRIIQLRKQDNLNLKIFSGLELGRQEGLEWIKKELST
ncbi:hypothetical protein L3081_05730 [Colwellia sp. MSW7]|uniref:Uncharacterized protein n=1 Tax=Colwellia maritima TaxID=2912588 RepID=A0ABS9WZM3_9GAMM|nr:hypothetical protein [Colwellia maritima]MCI2282987.1 hypothetical protein [Colwellia maritima]